MAQVKIGSNPTNIKKASLLELESANQGLLLPRLQDTSLINLLSPPDGMLIYIISPVNGQHLYVRHYSKWMELGASVDNSLQTDTATGFIIPIAIYQAVVSTTTFPALPAPYPGDGHVTFTNNEVVKLVFTLKGAKPGDAIAVTPSDTFNDSLFIAKAKVTGSDTVEITVVNGISAIVTPPSLRLTLAVLRKKS
ncbi:hypothetical protein [Chitinophaga niastensis]|nr:hypothetical protein [Chitinophaga niastensis]